jgi:cytochrome b561
MGAGERYTKTAIILHWLIALLMIGNFTLIWIVDELPEGMVRPVIDLHKSLGITVLGLASLRLLWRIGHQPPPLPGDYAVWEKRLSHLVHAVFYALMLSLPFSGWLHDSAWKDAASHPMTLFGLVPWPRLGFITSLAPDVKEHLHDLFGEVHRLLGYLLYVLLVMHIAAAVKHQWVDKQAELQRMSLRG